MSRPKVVFVEDDERQREPFASQLRARDFDVVTFESAKGALKYFRKNACDVILCDLHMPDMDGLELLGRIRETNRSTPFVIMTAHGSVDLAVKAINSGAYHFVLKPLQLDHIEVTIHQAIEHGRLEANVRESEAQLSRLMETVPDVIYSLDEKGKYLHVSAAVESLLGYKPQEVLGTTVFEYVHPEDRKDFEKQYKKGFKKGQADLDRFELRMMTKAGETRHVEISRKLVLQDGKAIRCDGIAHDVTERVRLQQQNKAKAKQLEDAAIELGKANVDMLAVQEQLEQKNAEMEKVLAELSQKQEELQAVFDSSLAAIVLVDRDGTITACNKRITEFFDVRERDIVGRKLDHFIEKVKDSFADSFRYLRQVEKLKAKPAGSGEAVSGFTDFRGAYLDVVRPANRSVALASFVVSGHDGSELGRMWIHTDVTVLRRVDEQVRRIVEAAPIPLIVSSLEDGQILFANDNMRNLMGFDSAEKLSGRYTTEFYYDAKDRDRIVDVLRRDGSVRNFELRLKSPDDRLIWAVLSLVITELGGRKVILGGLYDLSERKQAEVALQKERNFVAAVLDTAGALVVVLDIDGRIIRFNRACEQITGYAVNEVRNKRFWDIFLVPDEIPVVEERFEKIKIGPYPVRGENYWVTKSGEKRLISWSNTALFDENGQVEYMVAIGIDITEHKQADEALRMSEERFRTLVVNANDIICSITPDGHFSYISPRFEDMMGYDIAEMVGRPVAPLMHPDDQEDVRNWLEKGIYEGGRQVGYGFRAQRKDGTWRWYTSNASVLKGTEGEIQEIICVMHDITEMKTVLEDLERANAELKQAQARLVQTEKMASLGMLVAGIAHEINTPIGAVASMHNTLIRAVAKIRDAVDTGGHEGCSRCESIGLMLKLIDDANKVIETGTERVTTIVRRLRSFARLDQAELQEVDIREGLEDTLMLIHHEIKNRITVVRNYGDIPKVACFPGQLNQVFLNILNNARQAIPEKGQIEITTYRRDKDVYVVMSDDGVGIPKDKLSKVFDPGFTTKGVGVGTGLGLSICYQIIQDHRGEIRVESEPGKGATFIIRLPLGLDKMMERHY